MIFRTLTIYGLVLFSSAGTTASTVSDSDQSTPPILGGDSPGETITVTIVIDYGDGVQKRFKKVPCTANATVLDAMRKTMQHARGIKFRYRGSGETALLTQIDDLKNEGGNGKSWLYEVNGKLARKSFAIQNLSNHDTILWKFDIYR